MQVIGLCRFSYLGLGGFQITHDSLDERMAFLYNPDRLEERFRFFETITLPCIRAQTDPDFTFLIVIGDSFPIAARTRLDQLVRDIPQVIVQSHPPQRHRRVMRDAVNSVRWFDADPCLQFRLDDDDAVAITYVAQLRAAAAHVTGLLDRFQHVAIDFNQGYIAKPGANGLEIAAIKDPYCTAGLAVLLHPNINKAILNFGHHKISKIMPTLTFTDQDMMLRGHNAFNDSRQKTRSLRMTTFEPITAAEAAHFRATYNIDADHVRRVFAHT
ncbi:MAG: putative rhamnosyl transferase [Sulfitobacter sp.]